MKKLLPLLAVSTITLAGCNHTPLVGSTFNTPTVYGYHRAIDYDTGGYNKPVIAAADGEVYLLELPVPKWVQQKNPGYTTHTVVGIKHGEFAAVYAHVAPNNLKVGDPIKRGEVIGYSDHSGWDSKGNRGPYYAHVHFRLSKFPRIRKPIDPAPYMIGCFEPSKTYTETQLTFPVPCGSSK